MQTIYLDISNKGVIPTIYAKQWDVGRKFQVVLTDSGLPYIPVGGSAFSVWYSGASGEGNYTEVGDKSAFSVSGNKVTVEMISQMLSNDGEGVLSFVFNDPNGNQISTWNIPYICEYVPGADSEEAKAYYTAFSQAVENLPYPDASLSVSGKAADAAAVGAGLAAKAPAGYGLGEEVKTVSSIDNLLVPGQYKFYNGGYPLIAGVSETSYCDVEVVSSGSGCIHRITAITGGYRAERTYNGTTFGEWEWVNPPMVPGVEYRTTERFSGKPVYCKLVHCGTFPNANTKYVGHGVDNLQVVFDIFGYNDWAVSLWEDGVTSVRADRSNIAITTNKNLSDRNAIVCIKYIKTTD